MAPRLRVYVDLDDVVCQTIELALKVLRAEFGRTVAVEAVTVFDMGISLQLSPGELEHFLKRLHDPDMLMEYELCPGVRQGLASWRASGAEVWIVTGRPPGSAPGTEQWLRRMAVPHDRLLFVSKYAGRAYASCGAARSVPVAELGGLGFDLAVEDSAEMVMRLRDELQVPVLVVDRPWNRGVPERPGRVARCRGWGDVVSRAAQLVGLTPERRAGSC